MSEFMDHVKISEGMWDVNLWPEFKASIGPFDKLTSNSLLQLVELAYKAGGDDRAFEIRQSLGVITEHDVRDISATMCGYK